MRGIVSMAAALALPYNLPNGLPLPGRDIVIFITFCVIFLTLILPSLTLAGFLKVLNIHYSNSYDCKDLRDMLIKTAHDELKRLHSLKESTKMTLNFSQITFSLAIKLWITPLYIKTTV